MTSAWDPYIQLIQNTFNASGGQWSEINVCEHAAIYDIVHGKRWGGSEGFELSDYDINIDTEEGES